MSSNIPSREWIGAFTSRLALGDYTPAMLALHGCVAENSGERFRLFRTCPVIVSHLQPGILLTSLFDLDIALGASVLPPHLSGRSTMAETSATLQVLLVTLMIG